MFLRASSFWTMLKMSGIGDNARPPGKVHHNTGTTTTHHIPYDLSCTSQNRFTPLCHERHNIANIWLSKSEGSRMIQLVKNNNSYCPPIAAIPTSSSDLNWTTVKNRKSTMRKTSIKTNHEINAASPKSVLNYNKYDLFSPGARSKPTDINGRSNTSKIFFQKTTLHELNHKDITIYQLKN